MLEITRSEAERLIRTLDWVLVATLDTQESRDELKTIRDKVNNMLKTSKKDRIRFAVSQENEVN